jgi:hypothetical protein
MYFFNIFPISLGLSPHKIDGRKERHTLTGIIDGTSSSGSKLSEQWLRYRPLGTKNYRPFLKTLSLSSLGPKKKE